MDQQCALSVECTHDHIMEFLNLSFPSTSQLRTYMGTLPVSSIIVHYNKESKVVYGYVQSFKITLRRQGPFNDTDLQSLLNRIDGISSISRRSINTANYTFGVLGFLPTGVCVCVCTLARVCVVCLCMYVCVCMWADWHLSFCPCVFVHVNELVIFVRNV